MELSGGWQVFFCAAGGGLLMEILKWYQLREAPTFPAYARSPAYWLITGAMVTAAGVLGVLYGTSPRNAIMVLNIGISAPLIIKTLAETTVPAAGKAGPTQQDALPSAPRPPGYRRDVVDEAPPTRQGPSRVETPKPGLLAFLAWQ